MKTKIFCRTVDKGKQSFYAIVDNKEYFLFTQDYRRSVREFFHYGMSVNEINNYSATHSTAVRKILDKLPSYIEYLEKEFDLQIHEKSKKSYKNKKQQPYKREQFRLQNYELAI